MNPRIRFTLLRDRPSLAKALLAEVKHATSRLGELPESGASVAGGRRKLVLTRFPYSLFYETTGTTVRILAFGHHRRRPSY